MAELMKIGKKPIKQGMVTRSIYKFYITALLIILSASFLFPFIWLIMTSLKPIEQTMAMPPQWLPRAYYITVPGGEQVRVKLLDEVTEKTHLLVVPGYAEDEQKANPEDKKRMVRESDLENGRLRLPLQRADLVEEKLFDVKILQTVPASEEKPFWRVMERWNEDYREGHYPRWWLVDKGSIKSRIHFEFINYVKAWKAMDFLLYLKNTLIICLLGVIGVLLSNSLVAYAFSKVSWPGRDKIFALTLATMMIPFPVTMIPLYSVFKNLGMTGTLMPLWVPTFFGGAFNIFLIRQFFMTIPNDLIEAARIDGCSEFRIFWTIMLPLCKPVLAVVALFHFMGSWNDFMGPLIYLTDQKKFTLSVGLQFFQSQHGGTQWNYLMAASTMVLLPILILFFFTQKSFVEGISMTGMKG